MKKRYILPGALQADASTCTYMHTYTFVRAVSVSPGAKARNHAAWKKKEEVEEGPLLAPIVARKMAPGAHAEVYPTMERSNGRSAAGAETRGDSGELGAPSLLAARAGEGRRAPWRRRRRRDSRCPEDARRDNTLFVDPAATSRRTACFSSYSSFRSSFSPFIRPSPRFIRSQPSPGIRSILHAYSCFAVFKQEHSTSLW